jgi:lipopolysaccharide/colanic/teichoic acid biosynthesis glycosyltransferase
LNILKIVKALFLLVAVGFIITATTTPTVLTTETQSSGNSWRLYFFFKRLLDIVVSSFLIVLLSPLMILIALAIVLTDGGSPFIEQHRVGTTYTKAAVWKTRTFSLYKFRVFHRIRSTQFTFIGSLLRRTHLNELPLAKRFEATPGLTGWWQVTNKGTNDFETMRELDSWYVKHRSTFLDVKIMIMTPIYILKGKS